MSRLHDLGRVDFFFFVFFFYLQQPLAQCLTHEIFVKMKSVQELVYFFNTTSDFESRSVQVESPSIFVLEIVPLSLCLSPGGRDEM